MRREANSKSRTVGVDASYYAKFMCMTDAQRDAEVHYFDEEVVKAIGHPLNKEDKARHRRAKRGRLIE